MFSVGPGGAVHAAPGVAHGYRNTGTVPARFLAIMQPAGAEGFFEDVGVWLDEQGRRRRTPRSLRPTRCAKRRHGTASNFCPARKNSRRVIGLPRRLFPNLEELMRDMQRSRVLSLVSVALVSAGALAALAVAASAAVPSDIANRVKTYKAIPKFETPGPPIDASKAKGKTIFIIPESSSIPFINTIDDSIVRVAKMLGIKTTIYTNQAQPSQWAAGINQAVAQKPDLIMLQGAPDPRVLQPQLIAAKKAGIPVLVTHFFEESDPMPPNVLRSSACSSTRRRGSRPTGRSSTRAARRTRSSSPRTRCRSRRGC